MSERTDPFREIEKLIDRMTSEFDDFGGRLEPGVGGGGVDVDVVEDADEVRVHADLPGFETEDVDVALQDDVLIITADYTREREEEGEEPTYHRRERRHRSVSRRIRLPAEVDETETTATFDNGVLTVTLPKVTSDDGDGHTIEVS